MLPIFFATGPISYIVSPDPCILNPVGPQITLRPPSLQDVLTNLFGGLSLIAQRPFSIGDKITFKGTVATVHKLGYFQA